MEVAACAVWAGGPGTDEGQRLLAAGPQVSGTAQPERVGPRINPAASDHPTTMSRSSCRVAHRPSAQSTRAVINEHHRTASVARRTRRSDVATSLEAAQASAVATVFDNRMSAAEASHDQHDAP